MNFLAHSVLSGSHPQLLVGNFVGDFVKGKQFNSYPELIKKGILLHREIDSFTDSSEIVKHSKTYFSETYRLYSGIIVDMVYDHLLSVYWHRYMQIHKHDFVEHVYTILYAYYPQLPAQFRRMLHPMVYNKWMHMYGSFYGLEHVLQRMAFRSSLPNKSAECIIILKANYTELEADFLAFFPLMQKRAFEFLQE